MLFYLSCAYGSERCCCSLTLCPPLSVFVPSTQTQVWPRALTREKVLTQQQTTNPDTMRNRITDPNVDVYFINKWPSTSCYATAEQASSIRRFRGGVFTTGTSKARRPGYICMWRLVSLCRQKHHGETFQAKTWLSFVQRKHKHVSVSTITSILNGREIVILITWVPCASLKVQQKKKNYYLFIHLKNLSKIMLTVLSPDCKKSCSDFLQSGLKKFGLEWFDSSLSWGVKSLRAESCQRASPWHFCHIYSMWTWAHEPVNLLCGVPPRYVVL